MLKKIHSPKIGSQDYICESQVPLQDTTGLPKVG